MLIWYPATGWDSCNGDLDKDMDVDGTDIYQLASQLSVINPRTLSKMASELGNTACGVFPLKNIQPLDGQTLTDRFIIVEGDIISPPDGDVGININSRPAILHGAHFILNHVPLKAGLNAINITATDSSGDQVKHALNINATIPDDYIQIDSTQETGTVPLDAELHISSSFQLSAPAVITNSGPAPVTFLENEIDKYRIRIDTPGIYYFTATAPNKQGVTFASKIAIVAYDPGMMEMDALLRSKWNGMTDSLHRGDAVAASNYFTRSNRLAFLSGFERLEDYLGKIASGLHDLKPVGIATNEAVYSIKGDHEGKTYSFQVLFVKDKDGIWRIHSF